MNIFEIVVLPNNEIVYLVNGKVSFDAVSQLKHMISNQSNNILADTRYKDYLIELYKDNFTDDELSSVKWFKHMRYSKISNNINKLNNILSNLKTLENRVFELQEDISLAYKIGARQNIEELSLELKRLRQDIDDWNDAFYQLTNILI